MVANERHESLANPADGLTAEHLARGEQRVEVFLREGLYLTAILYICQGREVLKTCGAHECGAAGISRVVHGYGMYESLVGTESVDEISCESLVVVIHVEGLRGESTCYSPPRASFIERVHASAIALYDEWFPYAQCLYDMAQRDTHLAFQCAIPPWVCVEQAVLTVEPCLVATHGHRCGIEELASASTAHSIPYLPFWP